MVKLLFVQSGFYELDGILSINSFVSKKHKTDISIGGSVELLRKLKNFNPDVVGIYVITKDHFWALNMAKVIKKYNNKIKVILGGPHPTFYKKIVYNKNVDAIIISEAEKPILNFLDKIEEKKSYSKIKSLCFVRNNKLIQNQLETPLTIDEIPIPTTELYASYSHKIDSSILQVMCSRGCPFNCPFCLNYKLRKMYDTNFFRVRPVVDVIKQIEIAMARKKIKSIVFQDDIFGINKKWLDDFLLEYNKKIKLPFYCLLRCDVINEELIDKLKKSGCHQIGIGVESGDETFRNTVLDKRLKNKTIIKAANILKKKKLNFHSFNMFCMPGETLKEAIETVNFNIKIKPTVAKSLIFQPYPGTKFFNETVEKKVINPKFDMFKLNHEYTKDSRKIYRLQKLFMIIIKYPMLKYLLPILVRLPFDESYDKFSAYIWKHLYYKRVMNKK